MIERNTFRQAAILVALAVVAGSVSNATAGKERRLRWIADWSRVPPPGGTVSPSPLPVPAGALATAAPGTTPGTPDPALRPFEIVLARALA